MNLQEYIKELQILKKKHGNLKVVYSIDDEGNSYNEVIFTSQAGFFYGGNEFCPPKDFKEHKLFGFKEGEAKINCICIN